MQGEHLKRVRTVGGGAAWQARPEQARGRGALAARQRAVGWGLMH